MIENIEILLSYNVLSVQELFKILSENESFNLLSFITLINKNMESGISNYILSKENLKHINSNLYLKKDDKDNLINFFSVLGKSDLNGQITNCKTYKELFKKRLNYIEKKEIIDCKNTGVLIIGLGLLIIILLL